MCLLLPLLDFFSLSLCLDFDYIIWFIVSWLFGDDDVVAVDDQHKSYFLITALYYFASSSYFFFVSKCAVGGFSVKRRSVTPSSLYVAVCNPNVFAKP